MRAVPWPGIQARARAREIGLARGEGGWAGM